MVPEDTVCLSGYKIDIHNDGENATLFKKVDEPFGIPYECLVSADLSNLMMAGRNISVDDHVIGSSRVMSCCMALGQAAGLVAAMALGQQRLPGKIDVDALRGKLLEQNAILSMNQ